MNASRKNLLSFNDLAKRDVEEIFEQSRKFFKSKPPALLKEFLLANCFFEPSTRTRLSFEAAMHRLGGSVIGFADPMGTSSQKGESLHDTIKVIGSYTDIVVIRHPDVGAAQVAAQATDKPVINAGDGSNEHPTQTLIDLYTIQKRQGKIDGLTIGLVGDLKYGRTVHSLCLGLSHYSVELVLFSPESLPLPPEILHLLEKRNVKVRIARSMEEVVAEVDVLYMTRIQKERFSLPVSFRNPCLLKKEHLKKAKDNLSILHPLPRVDEIEASIDGTKFAAYFEQAANGVPVRMAILRHFLRD